MTHKFLLDWPSQNKLHDKLSDDLSKQFETALQFAQEHPGAYELQFDYSIPK
ncbi:MAG TPA: hypothetical protein VLC98_16760 [Phnomibacter sp.]|nr:hypothetical protein [Phnomibacter sp.]